MFSNFIPKAKAKQTTYVSFIYIQRPLTSNELWPRCYGQHFCGRNRSYIAAHQIPTPEGRTTERASNDPKSALVVLNARCIKSEDNLSSQRTIFLQVDFYSDRFIGTNLYNPSFAEVARTMGAEGIKVTRFASVMSSSYSASQFKGSINTRARNPEQRILPKFIISLNQLSLRMTMCLNLYFALQRQRQFKFYMYIYVLKLCTASVSIFCKRTFNQTLFLSIPMFNANPLKLLLCSTRIYIQSLVIKAVK